MTTKRPRQVRRIYPGLLAVQDAAIVVGAAFLLLGVLGFVPRVTTQLAELQFAGPHSGARLFGVLAVSVLSNLLFVALGILGLVLSRTFARARAFLLAGGVLFLGLWVWGLLMNPASEANVLPINDADNWLHLGLGVTMTVLALTLAGTRVPTGARGEVLIPPE